MMMEALMPLYPDPIDGVIIGEKALCAWTDSIVRGVGTPPVIAADVTEVLVAADLRGIASHGTARLSQYVTLVEAGLMDPEARPVRERGKPGLVSAAGRRGLITRPPSWSRPFARKCRGRPP